jgi:hypothetical protein
MRGSPLRQLRQYASPGGPALIRFSHSRQIPNAEILMQEPLHQQTTTMLFRSRSFFPRVLENVDEPFANLDRKKPWFGRGRSTPVLSALLANRDARAGLTRF